MEESGLVKYNAVLEILEDASFFGFTAHREDNGRRIVHTFKSIKWYRTDIEVTTLKLEPDKFGSEQIVLKIKINGDEIEGIGDFRNRIRTLGKPNAKQKK